MAKIQINEFRGVMPKLANDKLPNDRAQIARGLKTASRELVAYRRSTADQALAGTSYKSLFEYLEGSNRHWVYSDSLLFWARSPIADDSFERMYYVGESGEYRAFANDINSAPWDFTADYYEPGADSGSAPTITPTAPDFEAISYYYSYVSRYGEEGPGSTITSITNGDAGVRTQVDDIDYPSTDDQNITAVGSARPKIRVYRIDETNTTAKMIVEAEWFDATHAYIQGDYVFYGGGGTYDLYECTNAGGHSGAWNAGNFTQGEDVAPADATTPTNDNFLWDRAPANLTNLRSHPGGFFVASIGNTLYFTEPFQPHAWPEDYKIPLDSEIVGIGVYGSTIVVCTDAWIYTFSGPHPSTLYKVKGPFQPCLSQRAVVEVDNGVMFPSAEGFQRVSGQGVENVTQEFFAPEDWDNFELSTMHGIFYNKAYYGFFKSSTYEGFLIIDFISQSITSGVDYHYAAHVSLSDGIFRTIFASDITTTALNISQWDNDTTAYNNFHWKSPRYILEKPANFKVAQVILDSDFLSDVEDLVEDNDTLVDLNTALFAADLRGALNGNMINEEDINGDTLYSISSLGIQSYVEFNVYVDSVLKFTKQVSDSTMFKLPRGFKDKKWEIEVKGMIPVKRITMATSTEEIV
jgi:hypothetical protein